MLEEIYTPQVKSFPIKVNKFDHDYCVVYFHGLLGSSEHKHVVHLIEDLNKQKIDNCSFDFYGHGLRKQCENINDFDLYKYVEETKMVLHTLKNIGYKKFIFVGESFGGVLTQILTSTKVNCLGIIFLFSVFDFTKCKEGRLRLDGIEKAYNEGVSYSYGSATGASRIDMSRRFMESIIWFQKERLYNYEVNRGIPKLVIAGKSDSICGCEQSKTFANLFSDAKLLIYDTQHNGYDKTINKYSEKNTAKINKQILKFIKVVTAISDYYKK